LLASQLFYIWHDQSIRISCKQSKLTEWSEDLPIHAIKQQKTRFYPS